MAPLIVDVYDSTGVYLFRLPYTMCRGGDSINEDGSMTVDLEYSNTAMRVPGGLWSRLKLMGIIICAHNGSRIRHAGWLTGYSWDHENNKLTLNVGGGGTIFEKRLVLNHNLNESWINGDVLIDEDHPAGDWALNLSGSYSDIMRGLVAEALKWGALPVDLPPVEGGAHNLPFNGYDFASVSERLSDLSKYADGNEIRWDASFNEDNNIRFLLRSEPEIVDHSWTADGLGEWNSTVPGQRVFLQKIDGDGKDMTSQVYAMGGKDSEKAVVYRASDNTLTDQGYPLLQSVNSEHTTVTEVNTLKRYAESDLAYGAFPDVTFTVRVGEEHEVKVGDHADLRVEDDFLGRLVLGLKVTDVDFASDDDMQTCQARLRG